MSALQSPSGRTAYFRVIPLCVIPPAFVVAYPSRTRGELVAVSEHGTAFSAARESRQRNAKRRAQKRANKTA